MNEGRRKLIFAWMYREWGGAQIHLLAIMKLAFGEWEIIVVLPKGSDPRFLQFLDELSIPYEFIDGALDLDEAPTLTRKLERHVRRFRVEWALLRHLSQYDLKNSILHIDAAPWQSWQLFTLLAARGANVFLTLHNGPVGGSKLRRAIWKLRMHWVSKLKRFQIFASNKDTKDFIRKYLPPSIHSGVPVTYTCVDPVEIEAARSLEGKREALRDSLGIARSSFVVLTVGQFIDRKGRWDVIDAAGLLARHADDVVFVWLAPNELTDGERERINRHAPGNFVFVNSNSIGTSRLDILSFYSIADAFALPSYVEGLPIGLLEAMAMGLPSISTNVNAIPEAIENNVSGILIEPGDARGLSDAVLRLRDDKASAEEMAEKGRAVVLKQFDERIAAGIAIEHYRRCFADAT
jgi:glycosyltransferase involved in cell wall biosynthesis